MPDIQEYFIYLQNCREYEERPLPLSDWKREKMIVENLPGAAVETCSYEPARDYLPHYSNPELDEWAAIEA